MNGILKIYFIFFFDISFFGFIEISSVEFFMDKEIIELKRSAEIIRNRKSNMQMMLHNGELWVEPVHYYY